MDVSNGDYLKVELELEIESQPGDSNMCYSQSEDMRMSNSQSQNASMSNSQSEDIHMSNSQSEDTTMSNSQSVDKNMSNCQAEDTKMCNGGAKRKADPDDQEPFNKKTNKNRKLILRGLKSHEVQQCLKTNPIEFCQELGLMAVGIKCHCGSDMKFIKCSNRMDQFLWKCRKNQHNTSCSIRKGTFFERAKISLKDILWLVYMWIYEYSIQSMLHECDHSFHTLTDWFASCQQLCREILERKCDPIGGEKRGVEIFECSFPENMPDEQNQRWVFCALEQGRPNSLLIIIEDKRSETLFQILDKYILPGSILGSHNWSPFKNLTFENFDYFKDGRSLEFVNLWNKAKANNFRQFRAMVNQKMAGTHLWHKVVYEESFFEKMYRRSLMQAEDAYITFLKDTALVYKPCEVIVKTEEEVEENG